MANNIQKSRHHAIQVKWPVTIIKGQALIEGETRIVTKAGLFIRCEERLSRNDVYEMIMRPPDQRFIAAKGKLMWSNFDSAFDKGIFSGVGFYFAKITDEDRHLLGAVISNHLKPRENQSPMKRD